MKIRNLILGAFALLGVFSSCQETVDADPAVKIISESEISVAQDGGTQTITFTSATDWSVRGLEDVDWISVSPEAGKGSASEQKITVQVAPNSGADREASLTIYASPLAKKTVFVSQKGPLGDGVVAMTVKEFIEAASTSARCRLTGTISGLFTSTFTTFNLVDETGSILVYSYATENTIDPATLKNGGTVTLTGIYAYYESKSQHEVTKAIIEDYVAPEPVDPSKIEALSVADFISKADKNKEYRLTGVISGFNSQYCSFDLEDASGKIYVYSTTAETKTQYANVLKNGYKVTLRGTYDYYASKSQHEVVNATVESYEEVAATVEEFSGTVVAVASCAFLVKTADAYKYVFDKDLTVTVKVGDKVAVKAEVTSYNGLTEYENYTVTVSGSETVTHPEATALTGTAFDGYTTTFGYVKFSGKLTISGNYYNIAVSGATMQGSLANPVGVEASMSGKIVDVEGYYLQTTGSSTKYQNILLTNIALSADQTGADEGGSTGGGSEGGSTGDVSLDPGANEVLHILTNAEITAACSSTATSYTSGTIKSAEGDWTANYQPNNKNTFLQIRNSAGAYATSPKYSSAVTRVVINVKVSSTTTNSNPRKIYVMPTVDADALLKAYPASSNKYTLDTMAGNYGCVEFDLKDLATSPTAYECKISTAGVNQFSLLAYNGACYIDSIYVFCAK